MRTISTRSYKEETERLEIQAGMSVTTVVEEEVVSVDLSIET